MGALALGFAASAALALAMPGKKSPVYGYIFQRVTDLGVVGDRELWEVIGRDVPATRGKAAIDLSRDGQYGTFATVLAGQFVTHEVKSPDEQTEQAIFLELTEHLPDVPEAEVCEMAAAAVRQAQRDPA